MNVQQILFRFWVLAYLHVYFLLHNSAEKKMWRTICFLPPIYCLHAYLVYTFIWYHRVTGVLCKLITWHHNTTQHSRAWNGAVIFDNPLLLQVSSVKCSDILAEYCCIIQMVQCQTCMKYNPKVYQRSTKFNQEELPTLNIYKKILLKYFLH